MATKIDKKKLMADIDNLNDNIFMLDKELKKLRGNLKAIMVGDSDGPYWNGGKAKRYYQKAIKNLDANIADYCAAYNKLNAIALKYEKLVKNDK